MCTNKLCFLPNATDYPVDIEKMYHTDLHFFTLDRILQAHFLGIIVVIHQLTQLHSTSNKYGINFEEAKLPWNDLDSVERPVIFINELHRLNFFKAFDFKN